MLKVMGKGRRKVFNDVHIQRLPTLEHFFRITGVCFQISISAKMYFKIISCLPRYRYDYTMSCVYLFYHITPMNYTNIIHYW